MREWTVGRRRVQVDRPHRLLQALSPSAYMLLQLDVLMNRKLYRVSEERGTKLTQAVQDACRIKNGICGGIPKSDPTTMLWLSSKVTLWKALCSRLTGPQCRRMNQRTKTRFGFGR